MKTFATTDPDAQRVGHRMEFLHAALANSPDLVVVIDESATLTYVSGAAERIVGRSADEWTGRNVFELLHPDDVAKAADSMSGTIESGSGVKNPTVLRVLHADGGWREVEIVANNLLQDPVIAGILINARDVSERQESRRQTALANRRFEHAFLRSPIGMAITSLEGRFERVNPAMCELLGREAHDLMNTSILDVTHPDDLEATIRAAVEVLDGLTPSFSLEKRFLRGDDNTVWSRSTVTVLRDEDDEPQHFLTQVEDIEERRSLLEQLRRSALVDELTGLTNRTGFEKYLESLAADTTVGFISLDLDRFKAVNDSAGHAAGDEVLREVARRITATTRHVDDAARIGGDEFIVVFLDPDEDRLLDIAHRLVDAISQPVQLDAGTVTVGASVGLAIGDASESSELIRRSDVASYRAKRSGGNAVVVAADPLASHELLGELR